MPKNEIRWKRLYSVCVGMIGIQPSEFWRMSPEEVKLAIDGFREFHSSGEPSEMTSEEYHELKRKWEHRQNNS